MIQCTRRSTDPTGPGLVFPEHRRCSGAVAMNWRRSLRCGLLVVWVMCHALEPAFLFADEPLATPDPAAPVPAGPLVPGQEQVDSKEGSADTPEPADASESDASESGASESGAPASLAEPGMFADAAQLPGSFESLRPIFFFQGQASGLIPESFRPITISQLDSRLKDEGSGALSAFEKPQLNRAVYVARLIDSSLVSTQTTWEVSHGGETPARLSLGKMGLALQSTGLATGTGTGFRTQTVPVVTEPDGAAAVMVQGDMKLEVAWTAAGRESEREIAFDLAFPRSEQSRWLIELPQGMRLQTLDGVGQSLPSPPPEAGNRDSGRGTWYSVESGGLDRIRFRVLKMTSGRAETEVIVRQAALQYDLTSSLMRFTCRLVIDPLADGILPPFHVAGGRVTAVTVGGAAVPWNETSSMGGRLIRVRQERSEAVSTEPVSITLDGEAAWNPESEFQPMPWIELRECLPIVMGNQVQSKVVVDARLNLLRLELPLGWRYLAPVESDERRVTYRLGGPWGDSPPLVGASGVDGQIFAESLLRLSATESRFRATWESSISLAISGPQPIHLRVDPGWTAESVLLPLSGRAVDLPPDFATRRQIVIWPTGDELADGNLKVRVTGSRPFRIEGDSARYPATSFVTLVGGRNRFVALVTPPTGFRWDAEASLQNNRIGLDQLSPKQREMVDVLPPEAILLDVSQGRIASMSSRRPAAAFNVSSLLVLGLENDTVIETHAIKCESASGELDQIRVEFAGGKRADVEWSVNENSTPTRRLIRAKRLAALRSDYSPSQSVSAAAPESGPNAADLTREVGAIRPVTDSSPGNQVGNEPREIWDLELERSGSRGVMLMGRRESPLPAEQGDTLRIELPSVLGASNRLAQVFVPASLDVIRTGDGVLRVPRLVGPDLLSGDAKADQQRRTGITLRYDSSVTTWIEVAPADPAKQVALLWHESVDIIASGRGGDWIRATYRVDVGSQLVIHHDPDLRLSAVTDGEGVALNFTAESDTLIIPLTQPSPEVVVRWSRPATTERPWRQWTPPYISPSGVLLRRDWHLTAAPDTWAPESLLAAMNHVPRAWPSGNFQSPATVVNDAAPTITDSLASSAEFTVGLDPHGTRAVWLIDRSIALCLIAILGFLVFGLAWTAAARHAVMVGASFVISLALLPGFPAGWIYWIAAICVPIAAGGLIGTTLAAVKREGQESDGSDHEGGSYSASRSRRFRSASDMTPTADSPAGNRPQGAAVAVTERILVGLLALLVPLASASAQAIGPVNGTAASPGSDAARETSRPLVLVPTKPDGTLAGDKVYISQTFFNELFREKSIAVTPPLITSAVYRLRLDGMTESGMPSAEWEIRYALANLAERSEIVLPMRASQVRSVQWLPGGEAKPLRWTAEGDSQIRVSLPPTSSAAMLVRLATDVLAPEKLLRQIRLSIPPVTAASLVVDSGTAVQRFELAGALGQTTSQPESGRLSADLGAVKSIDLVVTLRQGARGIPAIAARRYWIHAAGNRLQVECEIDPGEQSLRRGTDLPIVILGGRPAILTASDWSIQSSEMISPQRQLLTCRSLRDAAGPIRLLWDFEAPLAADEADVEAAAIQIPDVISAGSAATPEALIATQASDGYRLIPLGVQESSVSSSADAIDGFVAQWRGFRGTASQVIRSPSALVRLAILAQPSKQWTSDEQHHLHVRQGELRLSLDASVVRGPQAIGPLRLMFPARLEMRELLVNGAAVSASSRRVGDQSEVAIPESFSSDKFTVRAVAYQRLGSDEKFDPPRIRIVPIRQVSGTYTLTRDQGLRVEQVQPNNLPELNAPAIDIADQLLSGYFPCWTWQISEQATTPTVPSPVRLGGLFRAEPQASRIDVIQRTAIRWQKSRWMTDVIIRVQARGAEGTTPALLDDLNIELPTSWSDQLTVEPAEAWSSQPGIDPAIKVIRIRPAADARGTGVATIRIRAYRIGESDSLLEVPRIRVMGAASTQLFLAVPVVAGGRPLIWQTLSAVADQLPHGLSEQAVAAPSVPDPSGSAAPLPPANIATPKELVFRALNPSATVRLQPSRPEISIPHATLADVQLFPQADAVWLAIIRWDVEPGDSDSLSFRIPQTVEPLALWTGGSPAALPRPGPTPPVEPSDTVARSVPEAAILDVTLALNQLAQPIVLLCRLNTESPERRPALPTLIDVTVGKTWVTVYRPSEQVNASRETNLPPLDWTDSQWQRSTAEQRLAALAASVLSVTDSSIGGATDRPQEELLAWLTSWDQRLQHLRREAVALAPQVIDAGPNDELVDADSSVVEEDLLPDPEAIAELAATGWDPLMARWREYVRRVTGVEIPQGELAATSIMPSAQWTVASVAVFHGRADDLPLFRSPSDVPQLSLAIHLLIALAMILGCSLLAWLFRNHLANSLSHPAIWLFALGLASLAVAPIPVAIAICLVALTAPWLNARPEAVESRGKPSRLAPPQKLANR